MFEAGCRLAASLLSLAEARLAIMIFHRVLPDPDPMRPFEPHAARFEAQMRWIRASFAVLPLSEAVARLRARTLPRRALAVTFDDGYRDNLTVALPIMTKLGLPFTVFVATAFSDGGMMWNDAVIEAVRGFPDGPVDLEACGLGTTAVPADRRAVVAERMLANLKYRPLAARTAIAADLLSRHAVRPPRLMMSRDELRQLSAAGVELGGHTCSHPILKTLDAVDAEREIRANKRDLEAITGRQITLFAYPNGRPEIDYAGREIGLLRAAGYQAAVSTACGTATPATDPFQLPRFTPWDRAKHRYLARMLANFARAPRACVPGSDGRHPGDPA